MANADPWHFSRPTLANGILKMFDIGLVSSKGVFAKRRMGKTEFLQQDLLPAALKTGYLTAYVNLQTDVEQPANPLLRALATALASAGPPAPPARRSARRTKLTPLDFTLAMEFLLGNLDASGQRLLLLLDEAQVLGQAEHVDLARALRAGVDRRPMTVKVVLAGSAETALRRMLSRSAEPLYSWAPLEPFELLGDDFVHAMVARVKAITRFPLASKDALGAFNALGRTPAFFREYLNHYLLHPLAGAEAALAFTRERVFNDPSFVQLWQSLLPADREILRLMTEGVTDLHGALARERLGRALGLPKPASLNTPQQALRRLQSNSVVFRLEHGVYGFEDDAFSEWVRRHGADDA